MRRPNELGTFTAKPIAVRALQMPAGHNAQRQFQDELEDNGVAVFEETSKQ